MEEIIKLLKLDPTAAISIIQNQGRDEVIISELAEEFNEIGREIRETQIGKIQKDKFVGTGEDRRRVTAVRIPIPFQNKIVRTSTAFEVGEPVTILSTEENKITEEINRLWTANRMDSKIQKMVAGRKSELQTALLFYIQDLKPDTLINRILGVNEQREIKTKVLENKNGRMIPIFDAFGDMVLFSWSFEIQLAETKKQRHFWVYDSRKVYKFTEVVGKMTFQSEEAHGFSKIPVVYTSQEKQEWFLAEKIIDRLEVSISKLGAANDYTAHPILKIYGEIKEGLKKDDDGKALKFDMKESTEGKVSHGDAEYLTRDGAAESAKLEFEKLEKYIYSLTSTPDISLENIKGIGNVSGVAIKLLFLDAIIKARMENTSVNQPMIDRAINVFLSGTTTTTATGLTTEAANTVFSIQFNSILPDDLKETVETYARAVEAGIMTVETAVKSLDVAEDVPVELGALAEASKAKKEDPTEV